MSVINQMLRDLDARGRASAAVPVAPSPPIGVTRRPVWLALGGMGLAAVAAIYWMLPAVSTSAAPAAPGAPVLQETQAVNRPSAVRTRPTPSAPVAFPSPVAAPKTQGRGPAPEAARGPTEPPSPASPGLSAPFQPQGPGTRQAGPAVVTQMTLLSPEAEAQQHYDDAQMLRRAGKSEAAMGEFRQALERNPAMTGARMQLARLLQEQGQADDALSLLQTGYAQRADDGLAIAAGRLLADLGQREAALDWLQRGQAGLRPADHALMGALLSQVHRYEDASRAYQRALTADPVQGGWLLGLGLALEAQGRLEEARTAYRNALEHGQFKPEVTQFLRERSGLPGS
jgi:MSHA biogenesis protein MshN